MNDRQQSLLAAHQRFAVMHDPSEDVEVKIEQRLVGIYSAIVTLTRYNKQPKGREILCRPKCIEDLELARDALSDILDKIGGK